MFQCTLCFGVLFNAYRRWKIRCAGCFNALCALGFSSTSPCPTRSWGVLVSMHSVLWGSLQRGRVTNAGVGLEFQCTLCFGVLFNVSLAVPSPPFAVSMHSVLWGSLQRIIDSCNPVCC